MFSEKYGAKIGGAFLVVASTIVSIASAMDTTPTDILVDAAAEDGAINVPLVAERWQVKGDVQFVKKEGFPLGLMILKGNDPHLSATLKDFSFGNGTIEFDAKAITDGGEVSVDFRRDKAGGTEDFYVRVGPDCPASQDCIQYAPHTRTRGFWDTYVHYEKPAPFLPGQWNHIKMVVSGRRMNVYVNRQTTPSLSVGRLEAEAVVGEILLSGPATYANFVVTPNAVEGLPPEPEADPVASDSRYLRSWEMASPTRLAEGSQPKAQDIPPSSAGWETVQAEDYGLINLARFNDAHPNDHSRPLIGWLKTSLNSDRNQVQMVSIGFLREVWVFVDGKLVYADKNLYHSPDHRKEPDGRISIENGVFELPLHKGKNNIVVALRSNTPEMQDVFGWGLEMRLGDLRGITKPL